MFTLHHQMFRVKRFLGLTALVVGGLIGASLLTYFSFAQSYELIGANLIDKVIEFIMPKHDVWLYAVTEPNKYTIRFNGNGSTAGSMGIMHMTYDETGSLLPNSFVRNGYSFKGWSSSEGGAVEYLDQAEVKNLTTIDSGEVILYAQRDGDQVPYTIEYYLENIAGTGYDLVETGSEYGPAGPSMITTGKMYTGFTLQTGDEVVITSGGSVRYHYTRNTYNLLVKDRDSILINTGVKYGANIELPTDEPEWTGNTFLGWDNVPEGGIMPANNVVITSKWSYGVHTITFDTDGGTEIEPITGNYGDTITPPENPTRTGFEFVRWEPELPTTISGDDVTVKAIWKEVSDNKGPGWSGGGGGKGGSSDESGGDSGDESEGGEHGAAMDDPVSQRKESLEVMLAYMWARSRGIIDAYRQDSDPDGYIPRGDMAELVVKFTENVIGRKIPAEIPAKCSWGDAEREWKSPETKVYAEKACALGVMGIRMQNFMPNKILDRAEFGTILSRLLWGDKYDVVDATATKLYYTRHLAALNREKVMTQIDNPEARKELRKWAWLMLMRVESRVLR